MAPIQDAPWHPARPQYLRRDDTHRLRNLHRPDVLRARLDGSGAHGPRFRSTDYVRLRDLEALRNELYQEWEGLAF
jgi:hypothetical protein